MKFYYCKSACSLAVRIILNELDYSYQDLEVDLRTKKTKNDEDFWAINPKGSVPVIMLDNGQVITENQVILQYLADTAKDQKVLAPVGDLQRYHTLEWLNYVATELHKSIGMFFNPALTEEMKKSICMPMIQAKLKFVNEHLGKNTYLMGEQFTLPDAYLFVILRWAYYFKMDLSAVPHIEKFMQHLKTRPSIVKALQQEQL
ncbi:MAG: Glutathione S-transferase GstA [Legionella sp.]|uniref:glutathione transferase GstA n=1 Tax=Legionella sp. TaxID=459 RepID=UPI003D0B5403